MKNIKIVFLDMDGTLLKEDSSISDYTKETLTHFHQKGLRFAIASGRSLNELFLMMEHYQIKDLIDYYIAYNGYAAYDVSKDELIETYPMQKEWIQEIIFKIKDLDINIIDYNVEHFNVLKMCPTVQILMDSDKTTPSLQPLEYFYSKNQAKVFISADPSILDEVEKRFKGNEVYQLLRTGDRYIDFVDRRLSKFVAISKLKESLQLKWEEMLAFGDGGNDIEMLKNLPHSVAMANAMEEVKKVATYLTLSNEEDGVAVFLNQHF